MQRLIALPKQLQPWLDLSKDAKSSLKMQGAHHKTLGRCLCLIGSLHPTKLSCSPLLFARERCLSLYAFAYFTSDQQQFYMKTAVEKSYV